MHTDRAACYRALLTRDPRFDGRFFTCVKTTGIYCRPICPARPPKLEHVFFVPSAAAAQEAGFRPCLRCRPETSPDVAAWHGTQATVRRALALIGSGGLNGVPVDALAGRLGIGERQLRRLFQRHVGASPKAVALTRRTLFAKQLITETALPMTEVALASGFGSLRRFNDTFQRLYGRPPSQLRRSRAQAAPASAITLTLAFKPPYDWPSTIAFLAARAIPGVEHVTPERYARTITLDGASGSIAVTPAADRRSLRATIRFPNVSALPAIVGRLRRIFDLDADPDGIGRHLATDPLLAPLVAARPGLRVPGAWDGFELSVRAMLGQQITVAGASRLAGRLVDAYGQRIEDLDDPHLVRLFPSPASLAEADLAVTVGMPRNRAGAIAALARAAHAQPDLFAPAADLEAGIGRLCALSGIGPWTAHYIAMRTMREPDAFPTGDIGLLRALATSRGRPSHAAMLDRAEAWRPWRAYAAMHLWNSGAPLPTEIDDAPHPRSPVLADRPDTARL
ncbi:AlkA N-terminal domain-containing protein [Marinivivus vitaminiproducens]|uniref:AlkA N-terminal domain-containing protein n=1 Tax=Marinivivus vitaminiproducens TaxID=3035935 RepID=UPI0027AAB978|nr:AlkA N-terminal domain-containing protein [Geminicoccaceae bacterium SCSIO 64248]